MTLLFTTCKFHSTSFQFIWFSFTVLIAWLTFNIISPWRQSNSAVNALLHMDACQPFYFNELKSICAGRILDARLGPEDNHPGLINRFFLRDGLIQESERGFLLRWGNAVRPVQKIEYIHNNPVEEGIVSSSEEYLMSSARNYSGLENVLEVICLTPLVKTVRWKMVAL